MKRFLGVALSVVLWVGCSQAFATETPPEGQGAVRHVVVVWLKEPGRQARDRYLELSRSLAALPGVVSYHAGPPIPSARSVVDNSYDVAVVAVLKDRQALKAYNANPERQKVIDAMRPLVQKVVVYDFAD